MNLKNEILKIIFKNFFKKSRSKEIAERFLRAFEPLFTKFFENFTADQAISGYILKFSLLFFAGMTLFSVIFLLFFIKLVLISTGIMWII